MHGLDSSSSSQDARNSAAMRETLLCILDVAERDMPNYCRSRARDQGESESIRAWSNTIAELVKNALSKPPRNCDRFVDELDAQLAFLNEEWLISVDRESMLERDRYENWTDEMRTRYVKWLLAPAAKEGDEK